MNLFMLGDFTLNSGVKSRWKIECDALTDDDWLGLAELIRIIVGPFSNVIAVPRGGNKLCDVVMDFDTVERAPLLIVDDVFTTGGSLKRLIDRLPGPFCDGIVAAVAFARGDANVPLETKHGLVPVKAVMQLPKELRVTK